MKGIIFRKPHQQPSIQDKDAFSQELQSVNQRNQILLFLIEMIYVMTIFIPFL